MSEGGYTGSLKVYPASEMRAIDMAEALRSVSSFNGIIHGCRLSFASGSSGTLLMTPGWVLIGGRVGVFEAPDNQATITLAPPDVSANNTLRYICIVCDLSNTSNPFYIAFLTNGQYEARNTVDASHPFNQMNRSIALKIGEVKVDTNGTFHNLDTSTGKYPDYAIKTDQSNVTALTNVVNSRWTTTSNWIDYLNRAKFRSAFFRNGTIVADGLTIPANHTSEFMFRKEYQSLVLIKTGNTDPAVPSGTDAGKAYIMINPDGTILSGTGKQSAGTAPSTTKEYYKDSSGNDTSVVKNFYTEQKNVGIVGVKILNATSGGSQGEKCFAQSYYIGGTNDRYVMLRIRNVSSAAAKIRVEVTCLYVQNIEFP